MIVDPDFLDHWRTGMVRDALADEMAPVYILRLWAHCQERKSDTFVMPTKGLKAQCKFPGDADAFEAALIDAGFLERDGATLRVLGWAEKNASLLAAWENGSKGGRPRKEPKENPRVTQEEPTGNPAVTHGEPSANPSLTHAKPIREEKSREEEKREETKERKASPRSSFVLPDWIPQETWTAYMQTRAKKKAASTDHALELVIRDLDKFRSEGHDPVAILEKSIKSGWTDVYAPKPDNSPASKQAALEARNAAVVRDLIAGAI